MGRIEDEARDLLKSILLEKVSEEFLDNLLDNQKIATLMDNICAVESKAEFVNEIFAKVETELDEYPAVRKMKMARNLKVFIARWIKEDEITSQLLYELLDNDAVVQILKVLTGDNWEKDGLESSKKLKKIIKTYKKSKSRATCIIQ